jgi:hypothetical protein
MIRRRGASQAAPRRPASGASTARALEYLAQMGKTIELTRSLAPGGLTPQMQGEFTAICRLWRAGQDGYPGEDFGGLLVAA